MTAIAETDVRPFLAVIIARWVVVGLILALAGRQTLMTRPVHENPYYDRPIASHETLDQTAPGTGTSPMVVGAVRGCLRDAGDVSP